MLISLGEILFIFILGLCAGSFINVLEYRINQKMSIGGRSICPHCRRVLPAKDLVPVASFIMLSGRCRYCGQKISWQYPIVELAAGLLFVVFSLKYLIYGLGLGDFGLWRDLIIIIFLLIIFIYDLKYYLILDSISLPAIFIVLIINFFIGASLDSMFWGVIVGGGFFLFQYLISNGKWIGGGDIRMGILMGIILGLEQVIVALVIAYILGAIVGLFLLLKKYKKLAQQVPFGTFLTIATAITMLFGTQIMNWYLGLI